MGSLNIPSTGFVYLDTDSIIYSVETQPVYWPMLKPLWEAAGTHKARLMSSELTLMETLVGPLKNADHVMASAYERLFQSLELQVRPISRDVLREAAQLRASIPALRTPDALHAATALLENCAMFVTNDAGFRRVPSLPVAILDEILGS